MGSCPVGPSGQEAVRPGSARSAGGVGGGLGAGSAIRHCWPRALVALPRGGLPGCSRKRSPSLPPRDTPTVSDLTWVRAPQEQGSGEARPFCGLSDSESPPGTRPEVPAGRQPWDQPCSSPRVALGSVPQGPAAGPVQTGTEGTEGGRLLSLLGGGAFPHLGPTGPPPCFVSAPRLC